MKLRKTWLLLLLFITLVSVGCEKQPPKAIDFGSFEKGAYVNAFFDLRIPIPESWHVLDDETRIELMSRGAQVAAGDNENLQAVINAAEMKNLSLLFASEKPPGFPTNSNPTLMVIAESITHAPGIKRGSDYHFHTRKMLEQSPMKVTYPREIYVQKIGNVSFDVLEAQLEMGTVSHFQRQYVAIYNNYALLIGLTYQDEAGLKKLEQILQQIDMQ